MTQGKGKETWKKIKGDEQTKRPPEKEKRRRCSCRTGIRKLKEHGHPRERKNWKRTDIIKGDESTLKIGPARKRSKKKRGENITRGWPQKTTQKGGEDELIRENSGGGVTSNPQKVRSKLNLHLVPRSKTRNARVMEQRNSAEHNTLVGPHCLNYSVSLPLNTPESFEGETTHKQRENPQHRNRRRETPELLDLVGSSTSSAQVPAKEGQRLKWPTKPTVKKRKSAKQTRRDQSGTKTMYSGREIRKQPSIKENTAKATPEHKGSKGCKFRIQATTRKNTQGKNSIVSETK